MPNSEEDDFFNEQTEASKVKSDIVFKYFSSWASIIGSTASKIGYLDFFCGPGKYQDGKLSTPLLILNKAVTDKKLRGSLVTVFQDSKEVYIEQLKQYVAEIPNLSELKYQPDIDVATMDEQVVAELKKIQLIPSLIFIDPFGYNGLSLDLLGTAIKDWGCDCIYFFNYNRINAALNNPVFEKNVNLIFGEETAKRLRERVRNLSPDERQKAVIEELGTALKSVRGRYNVLFKFYQEDKEKTSHFLALVTKHQKGYEVMKDVMAGVSEMRGGVPTYEFHPKTNNAYTVDLFPDNDSQLIKLASELEAKYRGKSKKVIDVYREHNVDTPYIPSSYKKALMLLEVDKKVEVDVPASERPRRKGELTLGDDRTVTFK